MRISNTSADTLDTHTLMYVSLNVTGGENFVIFFFFFQFSNVFTVFLLSGPRESRKCLHWRKVSLVFYLFVFFVGGGHGFSTAL